MAIPIPRHEVLDQTSLCAEGTVGAYRHTLSVPLPDHAAWDHVLPLGEPEDRATWTEITQDRGGVLVLSVVRLAARRAFRPSRRARCPGNWPKHG